MDVFDRQVFIISGILDGGLRKQSQDLTPESVSSFDDSETVLGCREDTDWIKYEIAVILLLLYYGRIIYALLLL